LGDEADFDHAIDDAQHRCLRICEQEKMGPSAAPKARANSSYIRQPNIRRPSPLATWRCGNASAGGDGICGVSRPNDVDFKSKARVGGRRGLGLQKAVLRVSFRVRIVSFLDG
jgi:hypothetical protein